MSSSIKIYFAADHAGYKLKEHLLRFVDHLDFGADTQYEIEDLGAHEYNETDDYPDFVSLAARAVSEAAARGEDARAIILGGSGQGEAIVANRFPRVRAVVFNGQYAPIDGRIVPYEIVIAREHNDANVLSLGARFLSEQDAEETVRLWLTTPFSGEERHRRRIEKIEQYPGA